MDQLIAGSLAFLDACADPDLRRIVIEEAPGVLGWSLWREIDGEHGLALLRQSIEELRRAGKLKGYSVDALAYLLSGAMNELAMWVSESDHSPARLKAAKRNIKALIQALVR